VDPNGHIYIDISSSGANVAEEFLAETGKISLIVKK